MYDATGKSNEEVFAELSDMFDNGNMLTLEELVAVVSTRSVVDTYASEDALTIFYSGESETFINALVDEADDSVRVIRRTEAYDFLVNTEFKEILYKIVVNENPDPNFSEFEINKEVNRLLYEASYYDSTGAKVEGEGFWTEISRKFAADTTGDAYSLCANAKADRIFARDELVTWLNNADDNAKMCGYTKTELFAMSEAERFNAVQDWTINDLKDTTVYFDDEGVKIGQTFEGTSLDACVDNIVPSNSAFETDLYFYTQYADDAKMAEVFGYDTYTNFTDLEKLQAKEIEYLTRQVANLEGAPVDNHVLNSYLAGSGKTIDQLDDMDRIAIRVSESLVNDSPSVPKLLKAAKNYEKIAKVSNVVGNVVDIAGTAFFIGKSIYDAQAAYDAGNENEAAGIVAGAATIGKSDLLKVA